MVQNDLSRAEEGVKHYAEDWMTGTATSQGTKKPAVPISVIIRAYKSAGRLFVDTITKFYFIFSRANKLKQNHFSIEESNVSSNMAGE